MSNTISSFSVKYENIQPKKKQNCTTGCIVICECKNSYIVIQSEIDIYTS